MNAAEFRKKQKNVRSHSLVLAPITREAYNVNIMGRMWRSLGLALIAWCLFFFIASNAHAEDKIVVTDFSGDPHIKHEAVAVSLLLHSMLDSGGRIIPRDEYAKARAKTGDKAPGGLRVLQRSSIPGVMRELQATKLIAGSLVLEGAVLQAVVSVMDAKGNVVASVAKHAPAGQVREIAFGLATDLCKIIGGKPLSYVDASLGQLRTYAESSIALGRGDIRGAASVLEAAEFDITGKVKATKDITREIWANKKVAASDRMRAALAGVFVDQALTLAGEKLKKKDPLSIATAAKAHLGRLDIKQATETLSKASKKSKEPALGAAYVMAAKASNDMDGLDAGLLRGAKSKNIELLRFASTLSGGSYSDDVELALVDAAELVIASHPRISSLIGLHSLERKIDPARAFALIRVVELNNAEIKKLTSLIQSAEDGLDVRRIKGELAMIRGDFDEAIIEFDKARDFDATDYRVSSLRGNVLQTLGRTDEALQAWGAAAAGGMKDAAWSKARALKNLGRIDEALAGLPNDSGESALRALLLAESSKAKGNKKVALLKLKEAELIAPSNRSILTALATAYADNGQGAKASTLRGVAEKIETAPTQLTLKSSAPIESNDVEVKESALVDAKAKALITEMDGLLENFDALSSLSNRQVAIIPLVGSDVSLFSLRAADLTKVEKALSGALEEKGIATRVSSMAPLEEPLERKELHRLAAENNAAGVIGYRAKAKGRMLDLRFIYFDAENGQAHEFEQIVPSHESVGLNKKLMALLSGIGLAGLLLLIYRLVRGTGNLVVRVKSDPAGQDEVFELFVKKEKSHPDMGDVHDFTQKVKAKGHRLSKRNATMIGPITEFVLPPGTWRIFIRGVYERDSESILLPQGILGEGKVKRGKNHTS